MAICIFGKWSLEQRVTGLIGLEMISKPSLLHCTHAHYMYGNGHRLVLLSNFKMAGHKSSQQQIEHLLFGSVSEEELKPLLDRLRGLCDFSTVGGVPFTDREIAYKIGMLV